MLAPTGVGLKPLCHLEIGNAPNIAAGYIRAVAITVRAIFNADRRSAKTGNTALPTAVRYCILISIYQVNDAAAHVDQHFGDIAAVYLVQRIFLRGQERFGLAAGKAQVYLRFDRPCYPCAAAGVGHGGVGFDEFPCVAVTFPDCEKAVATS